MEGRKREKRRKPARRAALISLATAAAFFFGLLAAYAAVSGEPLSEILSRRLFWTIYTVLCASALVAFLFVYRIDARHIVMGENDLEDSDWLTCPEIKKSSRFDTVRFSALGKHEDGTAVYAKKTGKGDAEIIMTSALHTLMVGTSGCGKTTGFVDQNIAVLSSCGSKPSLVITDPKKELFLKHASALAARGYDVLAVDLRSPYSSVRWNPLSVLRDRCEKLRELGLNLFGMTRSDAEREALLVKRQNLWDEVLDLARDVVYTLCPVSGGEQASWEKGARDLILAFVVAMCEDVADGFMPAEKLVLFNVFQNVSMYTGEDMTVMREYLMDRRSPYSKVRGLANTVLVTSDRTLTSYLSEVNAYVQQLSDDGILSMTSGNDIDFDSVDERPTAMFLIVPDEKKTRHPFVTLFVSQMYKALTEKCNENFKSGATRDLVLKRHVYFVLDEFGNIPKIRDMDNIISVARSRGIRFLLILQSLSQLDNVYSGKIAGIIRDNCTVKIFIGSDDDETKKTFSKLCGMRKIKTLSVSSSGDAQPSSSMGAQNKPLITEGELQRLNGEKQGDAIVCVRGFKPMWSKFTPSYELSSLYFGKNPACRAEREPVFFDGDAVFYDIKNAERPLWEAEELKKASYEKMARQNPEMAKAELGCEGEGELSLPSVFEGYDEIAYPEDFGPEGGALGL